MPHPARRPLLTRRIQYGHPGMSMETAHAGASLSDRTMASWTPLAGSADADLLNELDVLTPRSRDLARNNGLAAGAQQTLKDCIVGAQLRLSAMPDYRLLGWTHEQARDWGNAYEAEFRSWGETTECDAGRTLNLLGITLQAFGGSMLNGDAVAVVMWQPRPDARWSTRLLLLESDRMDTPPHLRHRTDIRRGIHQDQYGAPLGYWFSKTHPGDGYASRWLGADPNNWFYVPAFTPHGRRRVIHLHDKERTGQSRGKPIVSAVMREFHMAGKYQTTELQAAVANSLIAAFIESSLDQESAARVFGEDPRGEWNGAMSAFHSKLEGGAIIPLPLGAKLSSFAPSRPNAAFESFMQASFDYIGAGMNVPSAMLTKNFKDFNYSNMRGAMLEAWRYFNGRRRWLMDTWLRPINELILEEAINAGRVQAPDYYANRYAYGRCRFIFSGRGYVDPVKEATGQQIRMDINVTTLEAECAEQGLDYEEVLDQRAYEQRLMVEKGLLDASATAATRAAVVDAALNEPPDTAEPVPKAPKAD